MAIFTLIMLWGLKVVGAVVRFLVLSAPCGGGLGRACVAPLVLSAPFMAAVLDKAGRFYLLSITVSCAIRSSLIGS